MFFFLLQVVFFAGELTYDAIEHKKTGDENPNYVLIATEGFLEVQAQFYLFFVTPLRIADKYRVT